MIPDSAAETRPNEQEECVEKRPAEFVPFSVVVPVFNEALAVGRTIDELHQTLRRDGVEYELIVVNDGSTDGTEKILRSRTDVTLVEHDTNMGYGAALKTGIRRAKHPWIVVIDADGTYPHDAILRLVAHAPAYDMVVGSRVGKNVHIPLIRMPAKRFLNALASFLAEQKIPDLNSGLRVIRKSLVDRYEHLLPSGFSFTTTITLALLCSGHQVRYEPIDYHRRLGRSKIRPSDAYRFLLLIIRTVVYFNPLRVFLPAGAVLFLIGIGKFIYDIFLWNLSESAVMGIIGGMLLWAIGLLADQISRLILGQRQ